MTLLADPSPLELNDKKARKQARKQRKAELRLLHPAAAAPAATPPVAPPHELAPHSHKWLKPIIQGLATDRLLTATKSSFVVAINCLMLSVTAHALYRAGDSGMPWWGWAPLVMTNLLSFGFATFSLQVGGEKAGLPGSKEELAGTLTHELQQHAASLTRARELLRSAYHVLLGGLVLSVGTFALCLAFGAAR